ncbi:MAG TPA: hybrid sensor histidine kinase/response regulator [Phenylobacterium sp.]|nr:hybrid sensor histidine kinase/response regulator [Phenylobacterium sp.]
MRSEPARDPRIQAECVAAHFRQVPASVVASLVVTAYMAATAWPYTATPVILAWLGVQAAAQAVRFAVLIGYRRARPDPAHAPAWGRAYAGYMLLAGGVWGLCAFLFMHPDQPLSVALTLCGLYGISGGSIGGNAYVPASVYLFVAAIWGCVMARMMMIGEFAYIVLGLASTAFGVIMVMFTRTAHRTAWEDFRIRFENAELLEQLRVEKASADEARAQAEQASLAKSQFLAAASHDLRQPLYALSLFSASLQSLELDAEAQAVVGKIHSNIAALEGLFGALLDISKLEAGVVTPQAEPVWAGELFDRLAHYFEPEARRRGLELRFAGRDRWALTDPALLERILSNLIANAINHSSAGGVLVGCRRAGGGQVRFEVWDTGPGIAAADQRRIFDDYVQLANPERDRRKGLGLGLAIVRRTAALLGAEVTLRSRVGRGSVFAIALPAAAPASQRATEPAAPAADLLANLPVLVIDDEETVREALSDLLGRWGAKVSTAPDAEAALARLRAGERYRAALVDYRLREGRTGLEAISALRAAQSEPLACCLVTGDIDPALLTEARRRGLPVLHKPVQPAKLRAVLNHLASAEPSPVSD